MKIEQKCRDLGRPGCLEEVDERYTMYFDDIGEEPLFWCASCGPQNHALNEVFLEAIKDPRIAATVAGLIEKAEHEERNKRS